MWRRITRNFLLLLVLPACCRCVAHRGGAGNSEDLWITPRAVVVLDQQGEEAEGRVELSCHNAGKHYACFWFTPWGQQCTELERCDETLAIEQNSTSCTVDIAETQADKLITGVGLESHFEFADAVTAVYFVRETSPQVIGPSRPAALLATPPSSSFSAAAAANVTFSCVLQNPSPLVDFSWSLDGAVVARRTMDPVPGEEDSRGVPSVAKDDLTLTLQRGDVGSVVECRTKKLGSDGSAITFSGEVASSSSSLELRDFLLFPPLITGERLEDTSVLVLEVESSPGPASVEVRLFQKGAEKREGDIIAAFTCSPAEGEERNSTCQHTGGSTVNGTVDLTVTASVVEPSSSSGTFEVHLDCHNLGPSGVNVTASVGNGVSDQVFSSVVYFAPESHPLSEALHQEATGSSAAGGLLAAYALGAAAVAVVAAAAVVAATRRTKACKCGEYVVMSDIVETEV